MAQFKPNYIITEMKKNVILAWGRPGQPLADYVPGRNRHMEHVLYIDGEVGPGTFYSECLWFMSNDKVHPEIRKVMEEMMKNYKPKPGEKPLGPQPHMHPFDELFTFFGTNFDDPTDLCGEIEFYLEDQPVTFNKSCIVYIPAGMKHCPLNMKRLDRPIFHFSTGYTSSYDHEVLYDKGGKYAGQKNMEKYFVFHDKANLKIPAYRKNIPKNFTYRVAYLDSEVVPGSNFFAETTWIWPEERSMVNQDVSFVNTHTHPFPEVIGFFGSDLDDIHKLNGEVELWVEGKQYKINKSFVAIIPEGIEHGPLTVRGVKKPIFHYTAGPSKIYQ